MRFARATGTHSSTMTLSALPAATFRNLPRISLPRRATSAPRCGSILHHQDLPIGDVARADADHRNGQGFGYAFRQGDRDAVPVCGHLGLTPQSVNVFGGYKVQGRGDAAQTLFDR
jgi:hypothetical protein